MARVNVYLPDDLADHVKAAGLNVSAIAQEALRRELTVRRADTWLDELVDLPRLDLGHEQVLTALDEARDELGDFAR